MLIPDELRLLDMLAADYFQGRGVIVDAGCFLGGSTLALAGGVQRNSAWRRRLKGKPIHSYDLFQVEDWTRGIYFPLETAPGADFRSKFDAQTAAFADLVEVHHGDITQAEFPDAPIEVLFVDVAKSVEVCDWITYTLFAKLIPGRSIVVQQDYLYHHWNAWLHITMEYYADVFETVCDTELNSVAFRLRKPFPPGALKPGLVRSMPLEEKVALMDRAAAKFAGPQREWLEASKQHFLSQLAAEEEAAEAASAVPYALLMSIQQGTMGYSHRGVPALKSPFDMALYGRLLGEVRPATIIEIGSYRGGGALWLADTAASQGLAPRVVSIDIEPVTDLADQRIEFLAGDARALEAVLSPERLAALPRPWLVIEDAAHQRDTTLAVLRFFDLLMLPGEYIVVEDGILSDMRVADAYGGGPRLAIQEFLASCEGRYRVDRSYCDYYGRNVTWNPEGYLRRQP